VRELKRERAQLMRGGGGDAPGVLHARNQGVQGDMSLQDMFTGLQRSLPLQLLLQCITHAVLRRLKDRMSSAANSGSAVKDGPKALGE
jgi:hypothetical protein